MSDAELRQLELFAQIDDLLRRLTQWSQGESPWQSLNQSRALVRRLLSRLETLCVRLEAPLVVATFGGTGTGKSTLVNALVGSECTRSGRERPTTTRPVLIAHPGAELESLNLPLEQFDVKRVDSAVLRDLVILDCPDPDTNFESDQASHPSGTNLEILRRMLPHCDVLLYASTQQKYRSARVIDELDVAAAGCRLIFVQTHADHDSDVREDWREVLSERYDIPDVFLVDSVRAMTEQQAGLRPSGDFARLQDLLTTRLASVERVQIRRANLLDLTAATIVRCREQLETTEPAIRTLEKSLTEHSQKLTVAMSGELREQLQTCRHLWEQRLLASVTALWGVSPFSTVLRIYNGLGAILASATLMRARSGAQLVLLGAMQGSRWLSARRRDQDAEDDFEEAASLTLNENLVKEAQVIISGYLHDARLDPSLTQRTDDRLRRDAARLETDFIDTARRRIDEAIETLARRNSGWFARAWYELLFLTFVGYVMYRSGRNFFWDTFIDLNARHLPFDFYISAGIFFSLWSVILVMSFCRRLRRGLNREIARLADELAGRRLGGGLFPQLEASLTDIRVELQRLDQMSETCHQLRNEIATSSDLGSPRELNSESLRR